MPADVTGQEQSRVARGAMAGALALAALVVFAPVRSYDFINFDDPDYVSANPMVQAGLEAATVRWAFTQAHSSNWHPVTWLSHALDCQLFGLNAGAHHLVNVALHAANAGLLVTLLLRLTGAPGRSALVAALFALHPLRVESVAWVAERKDVLSALFGLLCLLAYERYARLRQPPRANGTSGASPPARAGWRAWGWYGAALGLFALGLMSKPMLVTWPCLLLLLDLWPLERLRAEMGGPAQRVLALVAEKLPFFLVAGVASAVTLAVQRAAGATVPLEVLPLEARLAHVPVAYIRYLGKTFWPANLAVFYPYTPVRWDAPESWASVLLLLTLTALVVWQWRARPFLAVGWLWFLGTLVPVIGLVQVGRQAMADRYTYLPHIGLFVALVWGVAEAAARLRLPRWSRGLAAAAVLLVCALLTATQLRHWRDTRALAEHTVAVMPDNYMAHTQLATALALSGQADAALAACRTALRLRPDFAEAHNTLGMIYSRQGRLEEALASYREAIRCDPTYPDAHHGLAEVLFRMGRLAEAEQAGCEAVRLWPLHVGGLHILASALHNQGKLDEAIAVYRRLVALQPGLFAAHRGLGATLALKGDLPAAADAFARALELQPGNPDVHNARGLVLLARGDTAGASNHFASALAAQPTNGLAHYQMALLSAAAGRPAAAAAHYRAALAAQPDSVEALNNLAWLLAASHDPSVRNGAEAVQLAERACTLTGFKEALLVGTLAAAYAEAGRFDEAARTAERAAALAEAAGQTEIAGRNRRLLALYRAGQPFHETPPAAQSSQPPR